MKKKNKYIEFLKNLFLLISLLVLIFGGLWSRIYSKDKENKEKKEDLKGKFELLSKFFLLFSPLALIIGSLWSIIYLIFIVNDFPRSIEKSIFYYIFAIVICLIIFIVYPLMSYLYIKIIEENNLEKENKIVNKIKKMLLDKPRTLISICKTNLLNSNKIKLPNERIIYKIEKFYFLSIYVLVNLILSFYMLYVVLIKGYFFIFSINSACEIICKVFIYLVAIMIFLMLQVFLYFYLKDLLKRIIIYRDNNALTSIILISTLVIMIYAFFFLTAPFYILKLGYFEASLTLDKEYVEKTELNEIYTEKCNVKRSDKPYEEKNKTQEQQQKEKKETQKLQEQSDNSNKNNQSQDIQNNEYYRTFKFFVFLRTSSEYIVGCSENSNVRIHIPSDKVIAIEY